MMNASRYQPALCPPAAPTPSSCLTIAAAAVGAYAILHLAPAAAGAPPAAAGESARTSFSSWESSLPFARFTQRDRHRLFAALDLLPLPDFRVPSLCSFMTLWTLRFPAELDDDFLGHGFTAPPETCACRHGRTSPWPALSGWSIRGGCRSGRIRTAVGLRHHRVFGVGRNPVFQQLFLAGEHPLSESLEIDIEFFGLGQHLGFFFPDVCRTLSARTVNFASR